MSLNVHDTQMYATAFMAHFARLQEANDILLHNNTWSMDALSSSTYEVWDLQATLECCEARCAELACELECQTEAYAQSIDGMRQELAARDVDAISSAKLMDELKQEIVARDADAISSAKLIDELKQEIAARDAGAIASAKLIDEMKREIAARDADVVSSAKVIKEMEQEIADRDATLVRIRKHQRGIVTRIGNMQKSNTVAALRITKMEEAYDNTGVLLAETIHDRDDARERVRYLEEQYEVSRCKLLELAAGMIKK